MFGTDRFVSQSLPRAAVSIAGAVAAFISTVFVASASSIVGCVSRPISAVSVAARPGRVEDVARHVSAAVVARVARRCVRSCVGGGPALGFKLTSCSLIRTDVDTGSSPQFMRLAYGTRGACIEEDALY